MIFGCFDSRRFEGLEGFKNKTNEEKEKHNEMKINNDKHSKTKNNNESQNFISNGLLMIVFFFISRSTNMNV